MQLAHLCQNFDNIFANCGENDDDRLAENYAQAQQPMHAPERDTDAALDASVWRDMPDSVLDLVFARLPLKSLTRVRSLSKQWRSTDFFTRELAGLEQQQGRLALIKSGKHCEDQEVWVFDTPAQEWCKFRLSHFPASSSNTFSGPFAAAGGLLCYISEAKITDGSCSLEIMVGNPLTHTWRLLPPTRSVREFPTLTHMSMTGNQYTITLVGLCEGVVPFVIEVYNSATNAWRTNVPPPQLTSYYNFFKGDEYRGLATIDTTAKTIKRLMYPAALQESSFLDRAEDKCWILESKGSLFMCSNVPRMEGLWQRLETQWQRVCPFPKALQKYEKTALYLSDEAVLLVGSEPHCFPPQFEDVEPHKIVVFNRASKQWSVLPNISVGFGLVEELVGGLMFEPRFDAKP